MDPNHPILLVDDDPDIREPLREFIENLGWSVCAAVDGQDAMQQLDHGLVPCLVFLDLSMPGMSGEELLEVMRAKEPLRQVPVVVLSAGLSFDVPGAVAVVPKPVRLERVVEIIERYCGRPEAASPMA